LSKRGENCRDERGRWDPGGGAVKMFETIDETLHREIAEEYGTKILSYEFLGFRELIRSVNDGEKTHWIALDYLVHVDEKLVRNNEPKKFEAVAWFRLNSLPSPVHSQLMTAIRKYEVLKKMYEK